MIDTHDPIANDTLDPIANNMHDHIANGKLDLIATGKSGFSPEIGLGSITVLSLYV
jgi:hypothetical protein